MSALVIHVHLHLHVIAIPVSMHLLEMIETDFTRPGIFVDDIGQNCTSTSTCCDSRKYPPWFTEKIYVHVAAQYNHVLMILNCNIILIEAKQFNVHVTLCTVLHVCYIIIADSKYYTPVPLYQA